MTKKLIRFDWAIKRLLRSNANFGILEGFLSELLKQDLKILNLLESESNKAEHDSKQNRVDILVQLQSGEVVLIEVQVNNEYDYFYRMLYGVSSIVTEYMHEGNAYSNIKKIYSVNILYFDLGQGEDYIYHGRTTFIGMHKQDELALNEKQKTLYKKTKIHQIYPEYYLIKVNQFNDKAKDTLDEWIYFLKNEEIKDDFHAKGLLEAKEKLNKLKLTDPEKQEYKRYLNDLHYQASMVETAKADSKYYQTGLVEGEEIGIEKGKAAGKIEGEKLGIEKGKIAEKLAIAKKMKEAGAPAELIQQVTGISADEI